ncbi:MAG TPA: hypothetical protein VM142_10250 [Acidimicrobiales bacterium]|nr:hypothetical protein [Acidimicrobiales bacterium]
MLFDCGGAWKPEGGALPWTERRLAGVVSDWIGQYADELDAERVGEEGDDGQAPAAGDDDEAELDVLLRMASRHAGCALVLEALERVASRRDQAIVLELRCQIAAGDPSPALTVAARHNVSGEVVRKAASLVRERLNRLVADEELFAGLDDLALVA